MIEAQTNTSSPVDNRLSVEDWQQQQTRHQRVIAEIVDPYLSKKQQQESDPVLDFLFEYYAFRPSHLKRWTPGSGIFLEDATPQSAPNISELSITDKGVWLDPRGFPENRKRGARWMYSLLQNTRQNKPSFGCFGMHEWAMVYKADSVRHNQYPLRMPMDELAEFVESRPLVCTHYDAFRFFTKPAKPMNKFELSQESFNKTEQAGCLHTNIDLYKWAFKLFPWIGSDIIRKAFLLAVETRRIDMKASPYDLRSRGLEPIKIETEAGRMEYIKHQKDIHKRSQPIREQLIRQYERLISKF